MGTTKESKGNYPSKAGSVELVGSWTVEFDPARGGPARVQFAALQDWTNHPDGGVRYYSGRARYTQAFRLEAVPEGRVWLDLGQVNYLATVRMNGKELGVSWCAPWEKEVTGVLRPGQNDLEIEVVNLWPNRLIGDEQWPFDAEYDGGGNLKRWPDWVANGGPRPSTNRVTFTTFKHYTGASPLLPSGLLGPVRLVFSAER
jgi:hypothetical protein